LCGIYQTVNKNLTHMGGCENENTNWTDNLVSMATHWRRDKWNATILKPM
jgi:hypothetical protein